MWNEAISPRRETEKSQLHEETLVQIRIQVAQSRLQIGLQLVASDLVLVLQLVDNLIDSFPVVNCGILLIFEEWQVQYLFRGLELLRIRLLSDGCVEHVLVEAVAGHSGVRDLRVFHQLLRFRLDFVNLVLDLLDRVNWQRFLIWRVSVHSLRLFFRLQKFISAISDFSVGFHQLIEQLLDISSFCVWLI